MGSFLPVRTDDEHARISADYLVNGPHMKAKRLPGKNLYKWIKGLSKEFGRLESYLNEIVSGLDLRYGTSLLDYWETAVGIPDDDFPALSLTNIRRNQALAKLASEGVSTDSEFERLCFDVYGLYVKSYPGMDFFDETAAPTYSTDPRVDYTNSTVADAKREARFTQIFEVDFSMSTSTMVGDIFPVAFPWSFSTNNWNVLQSFLTKIIPANVNAQFINANLVGYGFGHGEFGHVLFGGTP